MAFEYLKAGLRAQPEVQAAIERFRATVPDAVKHKVPLLYWLLGSGTPPYKMAAKDASYGPPPAHSKQRCANCEFAFQHVPTGIFICSQIDVEIRPEAWCRLWVAPIARRT